MIYALSLDDLRLARERIRPYVRHTPLMPAPALRGDLPAQLRLKLENLQVTGSFKARGVFNTLLQLDQAQRERGVVAASGGNHGAALAYGAWRLGLPATIFLPERASPDRVERIAAWGARVIKHGASGTTPTPGRSSTPPRQARCMFTRSTPRARWRARPRSAWSCSTTCLSLIAL